MSYAKLLHDWRTLLARRPTFREPLGPYEAILTAWAERPSGQIVPLDWSLADCQARWGRGAPLLAEASPRMDTDALEALLGPALDAVAAVSSEQEPLRRFAEAWDNGTLTPDAFLPAPGRIGSVAIQERTGISQETLAFIATASLRPILDEYFQPCREHLTRGAWELGICPFCGAPPAFADLLEDGQRQLACHVCGGGWPFPRLHCPYCGSQNTRDFVRIMAEDAEEGYAIFACKACQGYVKELDRRVRWDVGPALVEDWGTPHLDLVARRADYWRAVPTLIHLEGREGEGRA